LRGAHFAPGIQVRFGGRPATGVTIVSNTALSCTTPPGAAGAASVEVELLGMTARLASAFTYEPVVITQFTHDRGGPPVSVDLRTEEGKSYRLQRNLDLRDRAGWTDVGAAVNGSGAGMRFSDPAPPAGANRVFYRLIIAPR
jgi:hypothetical protein